MTISLGSFDERLGEAIHQVMWRRKITQTDFAGRVLGITQSALSQKLRGKRPFLAVELVAVADELGLDLNQLPPRGGPPPFDDGGGSLRARRYSKPQPSDLVSHGRSLPRSMRLIPCARPTPRRRGPQRAQPDTAARDDAEAA